MVRDKTKLHDTGLQCSAHCSQLIADVSMVQISVKCAARELADETARLGSRLLTSTIVGPASKHRRPRWRGLGEWESTLTQSLQGQSTSSASERSWDALLGVNIKDADRWTSMFLSAAKKS